MEKVQKNDFVALRFNGYANDKLFDSNKEGEIKQIHPQAEAKELIVIVGKQMVVKGLDNALEGKEIGKEYEVKVSPKEGFGERRKELVRTLPLSVFIEKNVNPYPGAVLALDDRVVRITAVSGARVVVDFNNLMAGKELRYVFTITRKVTDENEKVKSVFENIFRFVPDFEVKDKVIVSGKKEIETYIKIFSPQFKEIIGKELEFVLKEDKSSKKELTSS